MPLYDLNNIILESHVGEETIQWECSRCGNVYNKSLPFKCDCNSTKFKIISMKEAITFFQNNPMWLIKENKKMLKAGMKDELTEILTQIFQKNKKTYTTRFDEVNEMYCYDNGIYVPEGKSKVKEYCRQILQENYTEQLANRVISKIEADTFVEQKELLKRHYPELIAVKNGILNLKTKELMPFTPEKIFLNKINASYEIEATCQEIENFLNSVLPEKKDVETIYELFGYCLLGGYPIQKIALFIGEGGNGKGQTLNVLKKFLGDGAFTGIPLQKFEVNDFKESELFSKYANIGADISDQPLKTTSKIKGLCGEDSFNASRKFKQDLTFQNEAKLIFSANKLPKTYDMERAFFRRWVYLVFPYKFVNEKELENIPLEKREKYREAVLGIADKITTDNELSGLLCKSLDGLANLLRKGDFTSSQTSEETKKWWVRNSDSFLAFCWEELEENPNENITKEDLRKSYKKFCNTNHLPAEGDKHIHEIMTRNMMAWESQEGGTGNRIWEGVCLKKNKPIQL